MPFYTYELLQPDGAPGSLVELLQPVGAPTYTRHPETGAPVRKVITAPNLTLRHSEQNNRRALSGDNLARHGFTKYERAAKGHYIKTAGDSSAPSELKP